MCSDDDVPMLCFMAADVFSKFADECRNNSEIIHVYMSSIDSSQLYQLVVQCLHGALILFNKDQSIVDLLGTTFYFSIFNCNLHHFILFLNK